MLIHTKDGLTNIVMRDSEAETLERSIRSALLLSEQAPERPQTFSGEYWLRNFMLALQEYLAEG